MLLHSVVFKSWPQAVGTWDLWEFLEKLELAVPDLSDGVFVPWAYAWRTWNIAIFEGFDPILFWNSFDIKRLFLLTRLIKTWVKRLFFGFPRNDMEFHNKCRHERRLAILGCYSVPQQVQSSTALNNLLTLGCYSIPQQAQTGCYSVPQQAQTSTTLTNIGLLLRSTTSADINDAW